MSNVSGQQWIFYASEQQRIVAFIIDIALVWFIASYAQTTLGHSYRFLEATSTMELAGLLSLLYFPLLQASSVQGTFGNIITGTKVVNEYDRKVSIGYAYLRYILFCVTTSAFLPILIVIRFNARSQGIHDIVAKTYVAVR